jgi:hypothetical protein
MTERVHPELKALVAEAARALAVLDAGRLEELALVCQALNRPWEDRADKVRQVREAMKNMAVFGRVLEATRANLEVMHRLRDLREGRAGYGGAIGEMTGAADGNH